MDRDGGLLLLPFFFVLILQFCHVYRCFLETWIGKLYKGGLTFYDEMV